MTSAADGNHMEKVPITKEDGQTPRRSARNTLISRLTSARRSIKALHHQYYHGHGTPPRLSRNTPITYHPLLHPNLPNLHRALLLSIYDSFLILILVLHIYYYITSIDPARDLCKSSLVSAATYNRYKELGYAKQPVDTHLAELDFKQRCARLNRFIHIAGGVSSALAAMLAFVHITTLILRACEIPSIYIVDILNGASVFQECAYDYRNPPRDVDVQRRVLRASTSPCAATGRLSRISEEEWSMGGGTVRRRHTMRTGGSERWVGEGDGEAREGLEGVFLECLL